MKAIRNLIIALVLAISISGVTLAQDSAVNVNTATAEQLAELTLMAAEKVRMFGITPKVALMSHSSFGSHVNAMASKMRKVLKLVREMAPELEVEGEMRADAALMPKIRERVFPNSMLSGQANLLIMPDQDAAHIAFSMTRVIGNGVTVGPILMGASRPAHVLTPSATVRRVVNMTAIAVYDAQQYEKAIE